MGLAEKNAPYRLAVMAMGEHRSEEYLRRHPFARIPVLEHDGFRLYETQAILRYLDALFPQPEALARTPEGKLLLEGSPLVAWLDRMLARESMQATTRERLAAGALQPA